MTRTLLSTIACIALLAGCRQQVMAPTAVGPVPTDAQLRWHQMETNAFVHFTINTFTDKEWGYGDESPALFNPTNMDVNQWISTFKDAGFKGVILTSKHHDGFCLWPSQYTTHSVAASPYKNGKGNIVKEVSEACKKYGLKFGIYVSPWDRNRADYGQPSYVDYYRNQLKELFADNKPVFEMWFDGANGGDGYYGGAKEKRRIDGSTFYDWPNTLNMVRTMEPEVIFFSDAGPGVRWVGNERGEAGTTNWNTISPDTLYAGKAGIESLLNTGHEDGTAWIPAEVDVSIRPGWFYHPKEDSLVKSAERLFEIYLTSVGRGSTLLLNVPPDRRGLINERDVSVLKEWKAMRDREFGHNLAREATVISDHHRGEDERFKASNVNDDDQDTYWAMDDTDRSGALEITFKEPKRVKYVVMQEYIRLGQRIRSFVIEAFVDNSWKTVANGTTIGYKRIIRIDPISTDKIRLRMTDAKACPIISNVELY